MDDLQVQDSFLPEQLTKLTNKIEATEKKSVATVQKMNSWYQKSHQISFS